MPSGNLDSSGGLALARAWWWVVLYIVSWLFTGKMCMVEFPPDCHRAAGLKGVLSELPVLTAFSISQASFCGILDDTRLRGIWAKFYFSLVVFSSVVILSVAMEEDWTLTRMMRDDGDFRKPGHTVSGVLISIVSISTLWHFVEAWNFNKMLCSEPGGRVVNMEEGIYVQVDRQDDRHDELSTDGTNSLGQDRDRDRASRIHLSSVFREYALSRAPIVAYVFSFAWSALWAGDGWGMRYVLLSWVLSLLSRFESTFSTMWLAGTTAVFLQGIGSYSIRMLH